MFVVYIRLYILRARYTFQSVFRRTFRKFRTSFLKRDRSYVDYISSFTPPGFPAAPQRKKRNTSYLAPDRAWRQVVLPSCSICQIYFCHKARCIRFQIKQSNSPMSSINHHHVLSLDLISRPSNGIYAHQLFCN